MYTEAIDHLSKAVTLDPSDTTARFALGLVYVETGRDFEAKKVFAEILAINDKQWDAYYHYGKLLIKEGDIVNAKKILSELISKNPNYEKRNEVEQILQGL